jgi:hypothetical protein
MNVIKDEGLEFHGLGKSRELSLAITKIGEAVMWALVAIVLGFALFASPSAFAQASTVSAQPWVAGVSAYLDPILGMIVTAIVGFACLEVKKFTGYALSASLQAQIASWAATQAGALVAAAETNLAGQTFTMASPEIAAIVNAAPSEIFGAMNALGWTSAALRQIVAGEIGKLQSNQTAPAGAKTPS